MQANDVHPKIPFALRNFFDVWILKGFELSRWVC